MNRAIPMNLVHPVCKINAARSKVVFLSEFICKS